MFWSLDLGIWIICHKSSSKNKLCIQVGQIVYSTLCIALQINATNQTRAMAMRSSTGSCRPYPTKTWKRTSSTQQSRGKLAMRLEKSSNREAFEIDEVLNYVFKNGRFSISNWCRISKNINIVWVHQKWCNWRPFIFITPTERCFHWLRWMVRPSTVLVSHIVTNFWTPAMTKPCCLFFSLFQLKSAKKSSATKKKGCWQYEVVLCTKNPLHPLLSVEIPKEFFPSLGTALASTAPPSGVACEGSCV